MEGNEKILLTGKGLTPEAVIAIARNGVHVDYPESLWTMLKEFREGLEKQLVEHPEIKIYGTNVGCGDLKDVGISIDQFEPYQVRFVKAHNCGTGNPLPLEHVRAIM
ncbi:MAG: aromatic amino acid lyase, partial [Actinomycetaceae bacterium]|nr:aromatic amino acid lyase [Actinomycetaceae bacterium]